MEWRDFKERLKYCKLFYIPFSCLKNRGNDQAAVNPRPNCKAEGTPLVLLLEAQLKSYVLMSPQSQCTLHKEQNSPCMEEVG